jgi:hypothetical protein
MWSDKILDLAAKDERLETTSGSCLSRPIGIEVCYMSEEQFQSRGEPKQRLILHKYKACCE